MRIERESLIFSIETWPEEGLELDLSLSPEFVAGILAGPEGDSDAPKPLSELAGHLSLKLAGRRLLVRGCFRVEVETECDRCLEASAIPLEARVDEAIDLVDAGESGGQAGDEADDGVDGVLVLKGERFDLGPALAEWFWLAWPFQVVCRPDCRGLCPRCGRNLNQGECACATV